MKIIIWGHKLHTHTHSYIHGAFYKAFKHLGYDTYWVDSTDCIDNITFTDCIFLTEGQVDNGIPLDKSNKYILHNCNKEKYESYTTLNLQVYSNGKENSLGVCGTKLSECVYFDELTKTLYQPWATDLLPNEINTTWTYIPNRTAVWVGTIGTGYHGNILEIDNFIRGLGKHKYQFNHLGCAILDFKSNKDHVIANELAPTIVGTWQKTNGYVPCRIFKNISYGQLGLTNSETVYNLLENNVLYANNSKDLIELYLNMSNFEKNSMFVQSNKLVKEKHTYLNRIKNILSYL